MDSLDLLIKLVETQLPLSFSEVMEKVNNPEFDKADRVHDWRNYVPTVIIDEWNNISVMTCIVAFTMAYNQAEEENWE